MTDLKTVPSTTFPLFVHLENTPDIRALAIQLRWFPFDSIGCYSVLPGAATSTCGWTSATPPGDFEGDSSYTWSILFPPLDRGRSCVQYLVSALPYAGRISSADFILASVLVKDSRGGVDTILVAGGASILGGSAPALESVDPREIPARRQAVLTIKGHEFAAGTQVTLRGGDLRIPASSVLLLGPTALAATVEAPDSPGALLDVLVRLPDGRGAQMPAAVTIAASPSSAQAGESFSKPTNDAAAFRKFDLYADRITRWNVTDHWAYVNRDIYPSSLDSDALLVTRSVTDTMALFRSKPYDGIDFNCGCLGYPSYVGYAVTPPQYATSIGMLSMAKGVFNGTGDFNDYNVPTLRLTWTFADGDSASQTVRVGKHVRNWISGSQDCGSPQPYYVVPPDSLATVLYTGPLPPPWPPGDAYYDVAELPLAPENRPRKLSALRIDAVDHVDYCGASSLSTEHFLYGFSIWPNFRVLNSQGQPVQRQSQFTDKDHGGYLHGSTVVGSRRTTNFTACQVASMAMAYTYAGFPCTVDSLNVFLQRAKGYEPDRVADVTSVSPSGDVISYTATGGTALKVNDTFVVEHGMYTNPLATYRVTVAGRNGQASRLEIHSATIPSVGDPGRVYWRMRPTIADSYTHNPTLRSVELGPSRRLGAQVESLLVRGIPVQLNVPGHYVLADGWTSSFRPDGTARGTYSIKDPYDPRAYTKLIEGTYRNRFGRARYVVPAAQGPAGLPSAAANPPALAILASGARRMEVIDPLGRRMLRDAATGEELYEIPDASIDDVSSEHDNGGDADDPLTGYDVDIPAALDGHYTVRVYTADGLSVCASAYDASGIFASDDAADTTAGPSGDVYDVLYSGALRSVLLTHSITLAVASTSLGRGRLRVLPCPATGPVVLATRSAATEGDAIELFDLSGRKVDTVQLPPGGETRGVTWDWRLAGCRPGVYLARLRSQGSELTRFVVLY
ncbi:MAG TPA: hypothetical protein VGK89_04470 [Candidatus Eisenbacteria bacterium]